jgi:hypothetical protein
MQQRDLIDDGVERFVSVVECPGNGDWDGKHQTCDSATSTCAPRKTNAECTSGLCNETGACADQATLLYVNNAPIAARRSAAELCAFRNHARRRALMLCCKEARGETA